MKNTFCIAPMRGVTTCTYRRIFESHFGGLDRAISPFIPTVSAERITPKVLKDILPENNGSLPLIPQLISRNAHDMVRMMQACYDLDYHETNLNVGCPHRPVTKKMRGSGLLSHPDVLRTLLDDVCANMPGQLSVKVRLGKESSDDLFALLPTLNDYPLSEIIIHPRTAKQMYTGVVDVDAFEQCLPLTKHIVCYNGDIYTPDVFKQLHQRFPQINRWMLGRGLIRNPFLAAQIVGAEVPASLEQQKQAVRAFHDELFEAYNEILYGPVSILGKMKEMWSYLSCSFERSHWVFKKIKKVQTLPTFKALTGEIFEREAWNPRMPEETL